MVYKYAGDVGNAFLYGKTREKVFVIAGEEFGKDAGKRMVIDRSLWAQIVLGTFP
jgi:hypothetical protein